MGLMLVVGIAWIVLAVSVSVLIGRAIRAADARDVAALTDRLSMPLESDAQVLFPQFPSGRTLA